MIDVYQTMHKINAHWNWHKKKLGDIRYEDIALG